MPILPSSREARDETAALRKSKIYTTYYPTKGIYLIFLYFCNIYAESAKLANKNLFSKYANNYQIIIFLP